MTDIETKQMYIYNLMCRNKDAKLNDTLLYFLRTNNISCSENKNGYFINLSTLEDDNINCIYNLITRLERQVSNDISVFIPPGDISTEDSSHDSTEVAKCNEILILSENDANLIEYTKMI